jgi:2',3'-cyclic-nucleotide 2'-phosphodiesterase (5'-nucleotidase family)
VLEGTTRIVQTGSKASGIGRVDVWFDRATRRCVETRARVVDLDDDPPESARSPEVEKRCAELQQRSDEPMRAVIGELVQPLVRSKDPLVSGSAGNFIADAVREHTGAQVGLMNRGGIRSDVQAGPFTRRAIFELCPFDNRVSVLELSGAELSEMARRSVEDAAHSGLEVSGMTIEAQIDGAGKRRLVGIAVGGKPVEASAKYKVAMNSFMADGGDAYLDKDVKYARVDEALYVREMLELFVADKKHVTPLGENRYVLRKP